MSLWPPHSFKIKALTVFLFAVLGLCAIFLQQQKDAHDISESGKAQAELLNWQRGDPAHPPRFGFITSIDPESKTLTIRISVMNESEYTAYDINGRLWDLDLLIDNPRSLEDALQNDLATVNIPALNAHGVSFQGSPIQIPADVKHKKFAAQYMTRTGGYSQSIRAENVNGAWLFATRVTKVGGANDDVIFERVDEGFPRNEAGQVDWTMQRDRSASAVEVKKKGNDS